MSRGGAPLGGALNLFLRLILITILRQLLTVWPIRLSHERTYAREITEVGVRAEDDQPANMLRGTIQACAQPCDVIARKQKPRDWLGALASTKGGRMRPPLR